MGPTCGAPPGTPSSVAAREILFPPLMADGVRTVVQGCLYIYGEEKPEIIVKGLDFLDSVNEL